MCSFSGSSNSFTTTLSSTSPGELTGVNPSAYITTGSTTSISPMDESPDSVTAITIPVPVSPISPTSNTHIPPTKGHVEPARATRTTRATHKTREAAMMPVTTETVTREASIGIRQPAVGVGNLNASAMLTK